MMTNGNSGPTRSLPPTVQRGKPPEARAASLGAAGVTCHMPVPVVRSAASLDATVANGGTTFPEPSPGSAPETLPYAPPSSVTDAQQNRANIPATAFLKIVERTAIVISGQAGYAFVGAEPDRAGIRFGLLGLRLDTGEMGGTLRMALERDAASVRASLGPEADAILDRALALSPAERLAPLESGARLWDAPYRTQLSLAGQLPAAKAGQNRFAVEAMLQPLWAQLAPHPALADGTTLAIGLLVLAEMGIQAGSAAVNDALANAPDQAAFRAALLTHCPSCAQQIAALAVDPELANWTPEVPA